NQVNEESDKVIEAIKGNNVVTKDETDGWQKYKLTNDDGNNISKQGLDLLDLDTGFYETWDAKNDPLDGNKGIYEVNVTTGSKGQKTIVATQSHLNRMFINTIHTDGEDRGWKEITNNQTDTGWLPITIKNSYNKSTLPDYEPSYRVIDYGTHKKVIVRIGVINLTSGKNTVASIPTELNPYKIYSLGASTIAKIPPKVAVV